MRAACVLLLCLLFATSSGAQAAPASPWAPAPAKLLPNGGRPLKEVPFPAIKDWNSLVITFGSGPCNNRNCTQDYSFTLHGDGSFLYRGNRDVTALGGYRGRISQAEVKALVEGFRNAHFFWLFDRYAYGFPPFTYTLGIAFDGHTKTVLDINGDAVGMPGGVIDLRHMLEKAFDADTYRGFTDRTIPLLRNSGWNFRRRDLANIRLLQQAVTVTEFEGPRMVVHPLFEQLMAAGVPVGNFFGCKILEAAARTRDRDTVATLLAAGAPVQASKAFGDNNDCDALVMGAEGGDPAILKQLLARHPNPDGILTSLRPLMAVTMSPGYVPKDRFSVRETADGRFLPPGADLQREAQQMRLETVRLLLAAGANPRLALPGRSPLDSEGPRSDKILRQWGDPGIVRLLDAWDAAHPIPPPGHPTKIEQYLDRWLDAQSAKKP